MTRSARSADFRARLRESLGTRPGPELVALNASLLVEEVPPAPSHGGRTRIGLRTAPNTLIGREYDLDAVEDLVATGRLTTILGAGGLGKTRLAQEIGHRAAQTPTVVVLELASVRSGDDIGLALASTLGIREARSTRVQSIDPIARIDLRSRILGMLGERETLLIVDNCEHIVDAAAAWVADILDSTTNVRILATSRAPLAISAERVYRSIRSRAGCRRPRSSRRRPPLPTCLRSAPLSPCSSNGRERHGPPSSCPSMSSCACATGSTGCRWPSSSPLRASARCPSRKSNAASRTGSRSSRAASAPRPSGTARFWPSSTGAGTS